MTMILPSKMWISNQSEIAFRLGGLVIRWYSIFIMLGFLLAIILSVVKLTNIYKINSYPFYYFTYIAIFLSILGAKFWSCVITNDWSNFFSLQISGLAVQGGVILTVFGSFIFFPLILKSDKYKIQYTLNNSKPVKAKISYWLYFDAVVPSILIGQVVGRWGNYFNQEIYGAVVTNQKLIIFLSKHLPYMYIASKQTYCQPLFLWEGLINFAGFCIIYIGLEFIKKKKAGDLGFCYFLWYGIVRFILEPLREHNFTYPHTYVMSILWICFGSILIILNHTISKFWRQVKIWPSIKNMVHNFFQQIKFISNKICSIFKKNKLIYRKQMVKIWVVRPKEEKIFYKEK